MSEERNGKQHAGQDLGQEQEQTQEQKLQSEVSLAKDQPAAKQDKPANEGDSVKEAEAEASTKTRLTPEERAAKRAAAAAAKAAKEGTAGSDGAKAAESADEAEEEKPKEPSPNQPLLDKLMASIQEGIGGDVIEEGYINEADGHLPVIIVNNERWFKTAVHLKEQHQINYLINLSGVDRETHLEVVYHIESFETNEQVCVKVKTDRDAPSIPSVTPVWSTANWPEREVYDLLGVDFPGHPDLRRIMMPDDWVGHPLRKDYEPLDPEV